MSTHTSDSHQIPSQNKTKSKLQIYKNCQKFKFQNFASNFHATHFLGLFDKMYKYEMNATKTVGATEWAQDAGRTGRRTDRRTDGQS